MEIFLNKYKGQNQSVSSIIKYSKEYINKIQEKSLINNKAKEFGDKFESDFESLIKLSHERYGKVKSGNNVIDILHNQKKKLNKIVYSVTKNQVYKSDNVLQQLDNLNMNVIKNTDIRTMRLKIMDQKAYYNAQKYSKILKKSNSIDTEKNFFSGSEALNNLKNDLKKIDKEFANYTKYVKEFDYKKTNAQGIARSEVKKGGFRDFFSNNYSSTNFKMKPTVKVKVVKKEEKFDNKKLIKLIEQKKIDDQNLMKIKLKSIFDDPEVENFSNSHLVFDKNSTMNYIKHEVHNSIRRKDILEEKSKRLAVEIGEIDFPKIESYDLLIKKFLTAKHLLKQTRSFDDNGKDNKNKNKKPKVIENDKNNFFSDIRKLKKIPQVFIDQYTKREDFNEKNQEINKAVSNKKLGINQMNKTIEEYFTRTNLFLTGNINANKKITNMSWYDKKDQFAFKFDDPKYSIDFLLEKPINIFAKTQIKKERNGFNINQKSIDENYQSFMKRKEDFIETQEIKKKMRNSRSVENIIPQQIPLEKNDQINSAFGLNQNIGSLNLLLQKGKDKMFEDLNNIVNSKKEIIMKKYDDEIDIPLLRKRNMKNSFYNFDTKIGTTKLLNLEKF